MANRLTMATISAIDTLRRTGRSRRQVAQLLGIHRETVGKNFDRLQNQPSAPPGSDEHASDREAPAAPLVQPDSIGGVKLHKLCNSMNEDVPQEGKTLMARDQGVI